MSSANKNRRTNNAEKTTNNATRIEKFAANRLAANTTAVQKQERERETAMRVAYNIINTHVRNGTVPQAAPETFRLLSRMAEPARLRYIQLNPQRILRNTLKGTLESNKSVLPLPAHAPLFARIQSGRLIVVSSLLQEPRFHKEYTLALSGLALQKLESTNWTRLDTSTANFTNNRIGNELSKVLHPNSITKMLLNQSHSIPRLSKRNIEQLVRRVQPISNNQRNNKVVFAIGTPSSRRREFLEFARNLMDHLGTAQLTPNALANKSKWLLGSPILDQRTEYALKSAQRRRTAWVAPRARSTPVGRATSAPVARGRPVARARPA